MDVLLVYCKLWLILRCLLGALFAVPGNSGTENSSITNNKLELTTPALRSSNTTTKDNKAIANNARSPSGIYTLDRPISASSKLCENVSVSEHLISKDFFDGKYKAWERPLINARKPIDIEVRLVLSSVNEVFEKEKILQLTGYLLFYWWDEYHVWNTTFPHACLATVVMKHHEVWIPELAMINSEQHYALLLMHDEEMVRMYSSGYVSYRPGGTFRAYCDYDLTYFPFDQQVCIITMESWRYTVDYQRFHFGDTIQTRYWIENEQWEMFNTSQRVYDVQYVTNNVFSRVEFVLSLRRKVGYYLINVIVPSVIISVAEIATFTLPVDEVMKIHISFTCLLAYGVFQLMIIEDIPRTSERIPLLCYYIAFSMTFICLAMLGEGVCFVCFRKGHDKRHKQFVPEIVYKCACLVGKILQVKRPSEMALEADDGTEIGDDKYSTNFVSLFESNNKKARTAGVLEKGLEEQRREEAANRAHHLEMRRLHKWEFVADVVDRFVLVVYIFCITVTPTIMFLVVPKVHNP